MNATLSLDLLEHAADLISQADALIVAAGAGMGVDSGLPDFRGTEGFWKAYPVLGREQVTCNSYRAIGHGPTGTFFEVFP